MDTKDGWCTGELTNTESSLDSCPSSSLIFVLIDSASREDARLAGVCGADRRLGIFELVRFMGSVDLDAVLRCA